MRRRKTLTDLGLTARSGKLAVITGVSSDSRAVIPGSLFAALPGTNLHGARFVETALYKGATAILTDQAGVELAQGALSKFDPALVVAENPRQALAHVAALWYGQHPETMVAVTGTNGKTSVANFTRQIWSLIGYNAINLGTTGVEGTWQAPLAHTTPDPLTLHKTLANAAREDITHAAMEASSHGLEQNRLDAVLLQAAGFTNFSQDHLDYHKSFEAYFAAKELLFSHVLPPDGSVVINIDDPKGLILAEAAHERGQNVLTTGRTMGADLRMLDQRFDLDGQDILFSFNDVRMRAHLDLIGGFQADNLMVAIGLCIMSGSDPEQVFSVIPEIEPVRGRMQFAARRDNEAAVFVDYAHTPDAVRAALAALRPHVMGRLVVVLGAGGDRDSTKRALMGEAAGAMADFVIVTDDNPRTEDPAQIRRMVLDGALRMQDHSNVLEVSDRAEAILRGVDALVPGDALLIAGKGHETGQIIGTDVLPFDDFEQASVAVAALDGRLA